MIQNINFMGREECLTKPAKKILDTTHEYIGPGKIFEKSTQIVDSSKKLIEEEASKLNEAVKAKYAPIIINDNTAKEAEILSKEWTTAHGNPKV